MKVLALPRSSKALIVVCVAVQAFALFAIVDCYHHSLWLWVVTLFVAFFIGGFITDLLSGLFHFGFDYVWPPNFPIMGPIAVEFQQHHKTPTLDPSAILINMSKGAYAALPLSIITCIVATRSKDTATTFLVVASLMATSLWMLGFHQIHAYAHMGSHLSPEDFNRAVAEISRLPVQQQKKEFAKLFENVGIPRFIRYLQRCRLFLRPEVHWQHHQSFESDFSSVNGWSDPLMNYIYGPVARRKKAKELALEASQH